MLSTHRRYMVIYFLVLPLLSGLSQATEHSPLHTVINAEHRAENSMRDQYRHPLQTLEFFGIEANMTVIEVWPGKGWYSEILAPYLKHGGGELIAAGFPLNDGPKWRQNMQAEYQNWLATSPQHYDQVKLVELGPPSFWSLGDTNSIDAILTFRNVHNWVKGGYESKMFNSFYDALKPGGILGITDHRAADNIDLNTMKTSGYLSEDLVIILAQKAGFELEATSEINANPLDTKDHPKGVWSLPPTLRLGDKNRKHYLTIGESDRMTLLFRKPE